MRQGGWTKAIQALRTNLGATPGPRLDDVVRSLMLNFGAPPNDSRGIFHKKLLRLGRRALSTFVPGAGAVFDIVGEVRGRGSRSAQKSAGRSIKFNGATTGTFSGKSLAQLRALASSGTAPRTRSLAAAEIRARTGGAAGLVGEIPSPCRLPGQRVDPNTGKCRFFLGDQPGPNGGGQPAQPGAPGGPPTRHLVLTPDVTSGVRLRCKAGYVLGRDNLCYFGLPRNSKWRKWRPGRKAKFTAGDLNAIETAANLSELAEELFAKTNPAKKSVARSYRANWRKPLKK